MKTFGNLLLGLVLATPALTFARVSTPPENVRFDDGVYYLSVSPNGEWILSKSGSATLVNTFTGKGTTYNDCEFGSGNAVANSGLAVGSFGDAAAIFLNGRRIVPDEFSGFQFSNINCVTPDGSRIAGWVSTPKENPTLYVPFIADIDASGKIIEVVYPEYPKNDFFGQPIQYASAVWISDDGKTIVGQVVNNRGHYTVPLVYTETSKGVWEYSLPSEPLFNPRHIAIPNEDPLEMEPKYPEITSYINPFLLDKFQEELENYLATGKNPPDLEYFMGASNYAIYMEELQRYQDWEKENEEYELIYHEVRQESPSFMDNELTISPDGKYFLQSAQYIDMDDKVVNSIFKFDCATGAYEETVTPIKYLYPHQILPNGTVLLTVPLDVNPSTYLWVPGSTELVSFKDFIEPDYPDIVNWLNTNFTKGDGVVSMSNNMSVMIGGLSAEQYGDENIDNFTNMYSSYVLTGIVLSGVEEIVKDTSDGVYKIYDLKGLKVLDTQDASLLNSLPHGIYIVNGKKAVL